MEQRSGLHALETATTLLQRVRRAHPTQGLYEAADLQWRWRTPRATDALGQLFWFGDDGRPDAAVIVTDWGETIAMDPIVLPDATPDRVADVVAQGLAHARASGFATVELEVARADDVLLGILGGHGFTVAGDGVVETWLAADARPDISPLPAGYRLSGRDETRSRPHHLAGRNGPEVEARLRRTSLYRADLDLVVHDADDHVAAYGLFWHDPATATGLVEPMRTEDDHQRRGLARHVLTTGIGRLAAAGAERIKICYEPANAASSGLYLDVGFTPATETLLLRGPTGVTAAGVSPAAAAGAAAPRGNTSARAACTHRRSTP